MSAPASMNRRAILAGAAVAVAVAVPAVAAASPIVDRAVWDRVMTAQRVAKRQHEAAAKAWDVAHATWEATRPAYPEIARSHFLGMRDDNIFRLADLDELTESFNAGEGQWWFAEQSRTDFERSIRRIREYRARDAAARKACGYDRATLEIARTCDTLCKLDAELMAMPAPDEAALLWKLEQAFTTERATFEDDPDFTPATCRKHLAQTVADMRRLLGGEA